MTKENKNKLLKEITELLEKAKTKKDIEEIRRKAMRVNLKLPFEIKRKFCRKCHQPYENQRIRLNKGKLSITCSKCGNITRIPVSYTHLTLPTIYSV